MKRTSLRSTFVRLLTLGRPHRRVLAAAFGCMALLGLTTGAYAFLMGPALRFLLTGGTSRLGLVEQYLPGVRTLSPSALVWALPTAIVAVGVLKGVAYLGQFYFVGLFGQQVVIDLRRRVFERLLGLSPLQLSRRLSGDLLGRFSADVAAVEVAASYTVASYLRDTLQLVILVGVAFTLSWRLTLVLLLAVPIAVWPVSRLTRALLARVREGQAALGALAGQVQEGVGALRTIKAFDAGPAELERFGRKAGGLERSLTRAGWTRAATPGLMELLASAAIALVLAMVASDRVAEPERLVSFLATVVLAWQPAKDLGRMSGFGVQAGAALERLDEVLCLPVATPDVPGAVSLPGVRQSVQLQQVRFSWGDRPALENFSLELKVGQITALVGESGSGKSTVVSLLLRFEAPDAGRILVDGVDVATATAKSVRAQFALVTQQPLVFSASVRDNLLVARPEATDAELEAAARDADALEFIAQLPRGFDTVIGERGMSLSGGQRQRLCLARALLSRAPVLVLDEATSSLDPQGEQIVQAALDRVLRGRTALVIAHRLSTIERADQIAVVEAGRVVEQGTHLELVQRDGRYAAMRRRAAG